MRISLVIAALAVAAPLGLAADPASAQFFQGQTWWGGRPNSPDAPWCLNENSGFDQVRRDCSFATFSACQFALGNPNNGFCTQASVSAVPPPPGPRRRTKRRSQS